MTVMNTSEKEAKVEREGKKRDKETKRQREKDRKGRQSCC
jgi:hypothetical protein